MKKHKKIQEIFDIVVSNGMYKMNYDGTYTDNGSDYMCCALDYAFEQGYINHYDIAYAKSCIESFINDLSVIIKLIFGYSALITYIKEITGIDFYKNQEGAYDKNDHNRKVLEVDKILITIYKRWSHRNVLIKKINTQFPV